MGSKLPSSLNWLIDKRARIDAELKKTQASLETLRRLMAEVMEIEKDLEAIDKVLGMHEVKVALEYIKPIRTSYFKRTFFGYGKLTAIILECLKNKHGKPAHISEIIEYAKSKHPNTFTEQTSTRFHMAIRSSCNRLSRAGKIVRQHTQSNNFKGGYWILNPVILDAHTPAYDPARSLEKLQNGRRKIS